MAMVMGVIGEWERRHELTHPLTQHSVAKVCDVWQVRFSVVPVVCERGTWRHEGGLLSKHFMT